MLINSYNVLNIYPSGNQIFAHTVMHTYIYTFGGKSHNFDKSH